MSRREASEPVFQLRTPSPDHTGALAAAVRESMADLAPWMPWAHEGYDESDARGWIDRSSADREEERSYDFLVLAPAGELLGVCGLNRVDAPNRTCNLGYWVRSSATGRGLAPAAVRRLAEWAFSRTDLARLEILVAVENQRSLRVAEKAGAVREAVLESRLWLHEVAHAAVLFSLVKRPETRRRIGF